MTKLESVEVLRARIIAGDIFTTGQPVDVATMTPLEVVTYYFSPACWGRASLRAANASATAQERAADKAAFLGVLITG